MHRLTCWQPSAAALQSVQHPATASSCDSPLSPRPAASPSCPQDQPGCCRLKCCTLNPHPDLPGIRSPLLRSCCRESLILQMQVCMHPCSWLLVLRKYRQAACSRPHSCPAPRWPALHGAMSHTVSNTARRHLPHCPTFHGAAISLMPAMVWGASTV